MCLFLSGGRLLYNELLMVCSLLSGGTRTRACRSTAAWTTLRWRSSRLPTSLRWTPSSSSGSESCWLSYFIGQIRYIAYFEFTDSIHTGLNNSSSSRTVCTNYSTIWWMVIYISVINFYIFWSTMYYEPYLCNCYTK